MAENQTLTPAGWPRPIINGLPIPWVSPADDLATMNAARESACASGAICAVCGLGYELDEPAYAVVRDDAKRDPATLLHAQVRAMDNGVLHLRCLKLALARCPKLRQLRADGVLVVVKTAGNIAHPQLEGAELKAVIDPGDWEPVRFEDI